MNEDIKSAPVPTTPPVTTTSTTSTSSSSTSQQQQSPIMIGGCDGIVSTIILSI